METEIEITVVCVGFVFKGTPRKFDCWSGQWVPGEHPDVEGFKVFLRRDGKSLEITAFLSEKELEKLKFQMIDEYLDAV